MTSPGDADPEDRFPPPPAEPDPPKAGRKPSGLTLTALALGVLVAAAAATLVLLNTRTSDRTSAGATSTTAVAETSTSAAPVTSTTPPTSSPAPATSAAATGIEAEPAGLLCRDLAAKGFSYPEAVQYWERSGRPARMDATGTGIPCRTVYSVADVMAYWGESAGATIDVGSPLLAAYPQAIETFWAVGAAETLAIDLDTLSRNTSVQWTAEMLVALGTSYCNNWDQVNLADGETVLSERGQAEWANGIAPVLGISVADAVTAIESGLWKEYQYACE